MRVYPYGSDPLASGDQASDALSLDRLVQQGSAQAAAERNEPLAERQELEWRRHMEGQAR